SAGLFDLASFATCKFDESCQGSVKFDLKFTLKNGGKFGAKLGSRKRRKLWFSSSQNGDKFNSHKFSKPRRAVKTERTDKFKLKFESERDGYVKNARV
ncbi:hypothetical protein, partial [uncultured Campylobacter sp.]|uniref:hypothetical protein n=1 Tax=uncultured Campylobacter sp. TaxID=218934 RepID=UPI00261C8CCB